MLLRPRLSHRFSQMSLVSYLTAGKPRALEYVFEFENIAISVCTRVDVLPCSS